MKIKISAEGERIDIRLCLLFSYFLYLIIDMSPTTNLRWSRNSNYSVDMGLCLLFSYYSYITHNELLVEQECYYYYYSVVQLLFLVERECYYYYYSIVELLLYHRNFDGAGRQLYQQNFGTRKQAQKTQVNSDTYWYMYRDRICFVFVLFFQIRLFVSISETNTNTKRILHLRTYYVGGVHSTYVYACVRTSGCTSFVSCSM
jgi:hypothetical protein